MNPVRLSLACFLLINTFTFATAQISHTLTISGTRFYLDNQPFPYNGISFFNALFNPAFNQSTGERKRWLRQFKQHGIRVLRVWGQWDNQRGFADASPTATLYLPDGQLRPKPLATLKQVVRDANDEEMVVELTLFARESWNENIRLLPEVADRATALLTRELLPYRNVTFQIWNEFDNRIPEHLKTIKAIDPARLVTNSPGYSGELGTRAENRSLDFLTPHTSRQNAGKEWEIGPAEVTYLLERYKKPVVDDEPARNGTPEFGGPKEQTYPTDHILHIYNTWRAGGYVIYHHDMFQKGYGHATVPPSGIPDPAFNPYHRAVLEFMGQWKRYF
ncbi:MAG: hypothetical protein LH606_22415 [Cytophagaceae bacterium]|nr:hypothetical protein [Cytophagaceae bacterium]